MNNNDFYIKNNALQPDNSNKGKKNIVPVLILVLLVGVAGFLAYQLKFKKDDPKKSDEYVEYDPNYKLEDGENKNEQGDNSGMDDLIDVENPESDDNSKSNSTPGNILSNIVSNANKNSNSNTLSSNGKVTGVNINNKNITLYVGQTSRVSATVLPSNATNKGVTWKSSNTGIVTIDNKGNIVAKKVGSANITVTTMDGGKTSTAKVTVVAKAIPVTSIKLSPTVLNIPKGGAGKIFATISPSNATNKEVTWKSSNTSVATVDQNGNVTAKNYGTTIITATTKDGGKSAKMTVSVPQPQVKSISINATTLTIYPQQYIILAVTYNPSDAIYKSVRWTSSDSSIASIDSSGRVTGVSEGNVTITATTPNGTKSSKTIYVREDPAHFTLHWSPLYSGGNKYNVPTAYQPRVYKNGATYQYEKIIFNGTTYYNYSSPSVSSLNKSITKATVVTKKGNYLYNVKVVFDK